jgi:hypothetical protein
MSLPHKAAAMPDEAAPNREQAAARSLERMARASFGALSQAELILVRNAPQRTLAWSGPSSDPLDPRNDPARAASWGPERTIRASIVKWLLTDSDASGLVDPSGVGIAGARISGRLDLSFTTVKLPLTIKQSWIPGGMDMSHAELRAVDLSGSRVGPLDADEAVIRNDLTLTLGDFQGVSLFRAYIGGDLDGDAGSFNGDAPLSAVEATIVGDAHFHHGFQTDGVADFRLAHIGRSLSFNDARFVGNADTGLDAERADIAGTLYWVNIKITPATMLDLENARAGALWDDAASWPAPGHLMLSGFTYNDFSGGPMTARLRLQWIYRQPREAWAQPQPYREIAEALGKIGDQEGATKVMIAKEDAITSYGHLGLTDRIWKDILWITIGYGYRPLRALWWILGFVITGAILFRWGYMERLITPTEEGAYQVFVHSGAPPSHYPPFSSFVYSLENFLPVVDLHQGTYWRPNPHHTSLGKTRLLRRRTDASTFPARILRGYLWLHILAGWTITPLLFAGLAGLLRT